MRTNHLLNFGPVRKQLTLEYIRQRYDPKATSIGIKPVMIVVHWTTYKTLASTLAAFAPSVLQGRADLRAAGRVNVSAHFIVDRDGTIYKLMEETVMARHVIGLNRYAIGIENVGASNLTAAQLQSNTALVKYLAGKYPIEYLIGHYEYGKFRGSALWEERDPTYFTQKSDPGASFMQSLRNALSQGGLTLKAAP